MQQCGRDVDTPLHAARVLLHLLVAPVAQTDQPECPVDGVVQCPATESVQRAEERQVLSGSQLRVKRDLLRHDTQYLAQRTGCVDDAPAIKGYVTGSGSQQRRQHRDGG